MNHSSPISNNPPTPPDVLTARELEALLRIDVKTIYSYVQRGLIPYIRIQSNVRFVRSQILEWITDHNYRPTGFKR
jgi:excisionase family DNA binding protein